MQTMQQERAAFALKRVEEARKRLEVEAEKQLKNEQPSEKQLKDAKDKLFRAYKSHVSALPFMIHANGLGQAAAFYKSKCTDSKGKEKLDYVLLYDLLSDWLKEANQPFASKELLTGITESDMNKYMAAQAEAMVFMDWVKKFATAFMKEENVEGDK